METGLSFDPGLKRRHDIPEHHQFQWIDSVFPGEVIASSAELFGEDGARHQQGCCEICRDAGNGQRKQCRVAMRDFKAEENCGQGNTQGACKHGAHADERPKGLIGVET